MLFEIYASIVVERDTLRDQPLFHDVRSFEMALPGQGSESVDDPVARQPGGGRAVQCPSDRSRGTAHAEVLGDVTVGGHFAVRNLGYDVPNSGEEIVRGSGVGHVCNGSERSEWRATRPASGSYVLRATAWVGT